MSVNVVSVILNSLYFVSIVSFTAVTAYTNYSVYILIQRQPCTRNAFCINNIRFS